LESNYFCSIDQDLVSKKSEATWQIERVDINTEAFSADRTKTRENESYDNLGNDNLGRAPIFPLHWKNVIFFFSAWHIRRRRARLHGRI
jgi:hypothetical protein